MHSIQAGGAKLKIPEHSRIEEELRGIPRASPGQPINNWHCDILDREAEPESPENLGALPKPERPSLLQRFKNFWVAFFDENLPPPD